MGAGSQPGRLLNLLLDTGFAIEELGDDGTRLAPVDPNGLLSRFMPPDKSRYTNLVCRRRP